MTIKVISHRGNLTGPSAEENSVANIAAALELGVDVEVDVWFSSGNYYLGHDFPQYLIHREYLEEHKDFLWVHCKNIDALERLVDSNLNIFWHQSDYYTLTSKGYIWAYPGLPVTHKSVAVVARETTCALEKVLEQKPYAVCTDYVLSLLKMDL